MQTFQASAPDDCIIFARHILTPFPGSQPSHWRLSVSSCAQRANLSKHRYFTTAVPRITEVLLRLCWRHVWDVRVYMDDQWGDFIKCVQPVIRKSPETREYSPIPRKTHTRRWRTDNNVVVVEMKRMITTTRQPRYQGWTEAMCFMGQLKR